MNIQYTRFILNNALLYLLISSLSIVQAAEVIFTPEAPLVEAKQQITLSVSGMSGDITWMAIKGQIQGSGHEVTYTAPSEGGIDVVTVLDAENHVGTLKITVTKALIDENSVWKVFTNRNFINAILLSEDAKTLWVGTNGGLEKRDAITGDLKKVFTNSDGLPHNSINTIASDGNGGLWFSTNKGLSHLNNNGKLVNFNKANSGLPVNEINSIVSDYEGGVWILANTGNVWLSASRYLVHYSNDEVWTTIDLRKYQDNWNSITTKSTLPTRVSYGDKVFTNKLVRDDSGGLWMAITPPIGKGLGYLKSNEEWIAFNAENSGLPDSGIYALIKDGNGGLWIGTGNRGITYLSSNDEWITFDIPDPESFGIPNKYSNWVTSVLSDEKGGVWVGTLESGLLYLDNSGQWSIFNTDNSAIPSNAITVLNSDRSGGVWIGTSNGLIHLNDNSNWETFGIKSPNIPSNYIEILMSDNDGGVWVGTTKGLAHLNNQDEWVVFNTYNSELLDNHINALASDGNNGLWIGTEQAGIAHFSSNGEWAVFNTENSKLPTNVVEALVSDGKGGVWIGAGGLTHLKNGEWTIFNSKNSLLPGGVYALVKDDSNGVWAGTSGGLAHLNGDHQWTIFDSTNSDLPRDWIFSLSKDESGGLWIGTYSGGLAHFKGDGKWTIFNDENSILPVSPVISTLFNDGQGGVWTGNTGKKWPRFNHCSCENSRLAHLNSNNEVTVFNTFNSNLPDRLVTTITGDRANGIWMGTWGGGLAHFTVKPKSTINRAAIIIAGGGDNDNTLWETTESISNYLYSVFHQKGFNNEDIYYLSPKSYVDFNGDGRSDRIVDAPKPERPLTVEDVRVALAWAKTRGQLDQPLFLFFLDHGGPEKFQLSKLNYMTAPEFKVILDDYQTATGNEIIMVIDACYSGMLAEQLMAPKRAIISSTGNGLAYFDRKARQGFSRSFAKGLVKGMNFHESFEFATSEQQKMLGNISTRLLTGSTTATGTKEQIPQLEDGSHGQWLRQVSLNEGSIINKVTLKVDSLTTSTDLTAGQPFPLKVKTTLTRGSVKQVWAVIKPPKMNLVLDSNGTPILAFPRVHSFLQNQNDKTVWEATWHDAVYNGDYEVTFYAKDSQDNIASSDNAVVITVKNGVEPPSQSTIEIVLEKDNYRKGEPLRAKLIENLGWGYDLYAAVKLPNGQIRVIKNTNDFVALESPRNWLPQKRQQNKPLTLLDLTLPAHLQTGQYCLYGILSPENESVLDENTQARWILEENCFEVSP